ncbi:MAG TPA: HAMP domain-containing sensor histidine kinase, partial [Candidatus Nitrosotenuis sp.]|nr:HAMP domain-containing sensor histidine kinase [Candidatus Nitrosotenuis sp.]
MSDNSPYFFMKEFSSEELVHLLVNKVKELKVEKEKSDELNSKLEDNMAKLEEAQQEIARQRDLLQKEVKQKTEDLLKVERLSAIGQLSARIAHDLRNPLTVIQNSSKILRARLDGELDIKAQQQWERLDRAIYRMTHQLEDVMDYVRMPQLKKKDYSLSLIFQDVMERIEVPPTITIHPPLNDHTIFCDPEKMEIVFVNLFVNAIQAIGDKKGDIAVEITDDPSDENVVIKVVDTGIGIREEIIGKVFDPLFTTKQVGTGLGLSSCKSIVDQHGGTISVSSKVGKGTTFTIRMPKKSDWSAISKEN